MLLVFAWVFNNGYIWNILAQMERTADAAAMAGALNLVNDAHLKGYLYGNAAGLTDDVLNPVDPATYFGSARDRIQTLASLNPVNGKPFTLDTNSANAADGEIVFGQVPHFGDNFTASDLSQDAEKIATNAVKVRVLKLVSKGNPLQLFLAGLTTRTTQDLAATATAMLDRDVIGFQPRLQNSVPVAPLAFLADFTRTNSESWNAQVEVYTVAKDNFGFDAGTKQFNMGSSDGLTEFTATLALSSGEAGNANAAFLFVGTTLGDFDALNQQLLTGFTAAQFTAFGQPFVLNSTTNNLNVPGTLVGPTASSQQQTLHDNLDQLRQDAAIRIFPLYSTVDGSGNPVLCGFVAGRIASVSALGGDTLTIVVQPTMLAVNAAVTNRAHDGVNGVPIVNSYISKVRLVE